MNYIIEYIVIFILCLSFTFIFGILIGKLKIFKNKHFRTASYLIAFISFILFLWYTVNTHLSFTILEDISFNGIVMYSLCLPIWFYFGTRVSYKRENGYYISKVGLIINKIIGCLIVLNSIGDINGFYIIDDQIDQNYKFIFYVIVVIFITTKIVFGILLFTNKSKTTPKEGLVLDTQEINQIERRVDTSNPSYIEDSTLNSKFLSVETPKEFKIYNSITQMVLFKQIKREKDYNEGIRRIIIVLSLTLPILIAYFIDQENYKEFHCFLLYFIILYFVFHILIIILVWIKTGFNTN